MKCCTPGRNVICPTCGEPAGSILRDPIAHPFTRNADSGLCWTCGLEEGEGAHFDDGCVFCDIARRIRKPGPPPTVGPPGKILHDTGSVLVFEPVRPVTAGHVLVVPYRHVRHALADLEVTAEVFGVAARYAGLIREKFRQMDAATGRLGPINEVGVNLITSAGRAATQTVDHLHVHIVPRFDGDGLPLPWTPQQESSDRLRNELVDTMMGNLKIPESLRRPHPVDDVLTRFGVLQSNLAQLTDELHAAGYTIARAGRVVERGRKT